MAPTPYRISTSRPVAHVPKEELSEFIEKVRKLAYEKGSELIKAEELVVRDLLWTDLGLTGNEWSVNIGSTGEVKVIEHTLDDKTLIVIYAVGDAETSPNVTQVVFGTGAGDKARVILEDAYVTDIPEKILDSPVVITPAQKLVVKVVAKGTNATEKLYFKGFVVEPRGRTIST